MGAVPNTIEASKKIMADITGLTDDEVMNLDLTDEELQAAVEAEMKEASLSGLERMRRDNPALNDAWEQIKTIRALTEKQDVNDSTPSWLKHYNQIADGLETDNAALKEAWDRYYVLKNLMMNPKTPI